MGSQWLEVAVALAVALPLAGITLWRPAAGCAVLALLVPLTAGIARDTLIPVLRPSEALTMIVFAGLVLNIAVRRRRLVFVGLDMVVLVFVLVEVLIPLVLFLLRQVHVDVATWRAILGPLQYLAVYILFSRCEPGSRGLRWIVNLTFLASIAVAAVAVLEAFSSGFHDLVSILYEESPTASWDPVYRPSSLVSHYSAAAGFALLTSCLAAALLVVRHRQFPAPWLGVVLAANFCGLLVSQTWAPMIALPAVAGVICLHARRIPWRPLILAILLAAAGAVAFSPFASERVKQQAVFAPGGGLSLPTSLETRLRYWQEFFVPAALDDFWLGTATDAVTGGYPTPSIVPEGLSKFIDDEYLYEVLRAGVFALVMLLVLFAALGLAGWRARSSLDPMVRALGAACVASVVALVITGITSEYLTFSALTQLFWMQVGLLVAVRPDAPLAAGDAPDVVWPALRPRLAREAWS